jgi:hypothetical protein
MIEELLERRSNKDKEDFILGLVLALALGPALWLALALVLVLALALALGLALWLALALVLGLALWLAVIENKMQAIGYLTGYLILVPSVYFLFTLQGIPLLQIAAILATTEILFWLSKKKPSKADKEHILKFTAFRKLIHLGEALVIILPASGAFVFAQKEALPYLMKNWSFLLTWAGYLGLALIACGIAIAAIWLYLKLNSLKFRENKSGKVRK